MYLKYIRDGLKPYSPCLKWHTFYKPYYIRGKNLIEPIRCISVIEHIRYIGCIRLIDRTRRIGCTRVYNVYVLYGPSYIHRFYKIFPRWFGLKLGLELGLELGLRLGFRYKVRARLSTFYKTNTYYRMYTGLR